MILSSGAEVDETAMGLGAHEAGNVLQRQVPWQVLHGNPRQDLHEGNEALCPIVIKVTPGATFTVGLAGWREPPEIRVQSGKFPGADPFQVDLANRVVREVESVAREGRMVLVQRSRHLD